MPLTIQIPERELYDEANNQFIDLPAKKLVLEHSLISISRWEAKWHKPFFSRTQKTKQEMTDYISCMVIGQEPDPLILEGLTRKNVQEINDYLNNTMTATTINSKNRRSSREIITSELVYCWMTQLNIPFDPCEKWHINRLMTLIEVCAIKSEPPKKMSKGAIMRQNHSLNQARRAAYGTRG